MEAVYCCQQLSQYVSDLARTAYGTVYMYVMKVSKIASVKGIHCTLFYHNDIYLYSLYHTNAFLKIQCLKKSFATVSHIIIK
jgi:hypothetical protein